jgi:PAS domain S-box-containing protein
MVCLAATYLIVCGKYESIDTQRSARVVGKREGLTATACESPPGPFRAATAAPDDRHRAELAWNLMLRRLPALVWTTDRNLQIASLGGTACGEFAEGASGLIGRPIVTFLGSATDQDLPLVQAHECALQGQSISLEHIWRRKAYRLYVEPLPAENGAAEGCVGMAIDVTPRKHHDYVIHFPWNAAADEAATNTGRRKIQERLEAEVDDRRHAEQSLRENHDRLLQSAATVDSAFWIENVRESRIIYLSPGYERIWGEVFPSSERGYPIWDCILEEDRPKVKRLAADSHAGESRTEDVRIQRADGKLRWIRIRAFAIRGGDGSIERVAGIVEDITARKDAEEFERRNERLTTLGNFVAGIAHEINNPLGAALAATQAALRFLDQHPALAHLKQAGAPPLAECLENSLAGVRRCSQIVRSLLRFCRDEPAARVPFDLREALAAAESITGTYAATNQCKLVLFPPEHPLIVEGSAIELEMVFVNLFRNAVEAGAMRIEVVARRQNSSAGDGIDVTVTDDGCGIPTDDRAKLCDPFFTTKRKSGGTGLGLSIVHSIVRDHGGQLEFLPLGKGAGVRILLPLATTPAESP